jgi:hypothetical protein
MSSKFVKLLQQKISAKQKNGDELRKQMIQYQEKYASLTQNKMQEGFV